MNRRQLLAGIAASALPTPKANGGIVQPGHYIVGEHANDAADYMSRFMGIDLSSKPDQTAYVVIRYPWSSQ